MLFEMKVPLIVQHYIFLEDFFWINELLILAELVRKSNIKPFGMTVMIWFFLFTSLYKCASVIML